MDKTTTAIIVDYDHFLHSKWDQDFVQNRGEHAKVVLFIDSPLPDSDVHDLYDWDVVISNAKGIPKAEFRVAALAALSNHSNIYPAIALDSYKYEEIYMEAGVLLLLDTEDKEYVRV